MTQIPEDVMKLAEDALRDAVKLTAKANAKHSDWEAARSIIARALTDREAREQAPYSHVRVRHKKRGTTYDVIATGRLQVDGDLDMEKVTVYRGEDGQVWVRPEYEFYDGRFEILATEGKANG